MMHPPSLAAPCPPAQPSPAKVSFIELFLSFLLPWRVEQQVPLRVKRARLHGLRELVAFGRVRETSA
jgi:hypothetical protein